MASGSYWCYSCSRFVSVTNPDFITCPDCDGGFVEEIQDPSGFIHADFHHRPRVSRRRLATPAYTPGSFSPAFESATSSPTSALRRTRRIGGGGGGGGDRSPMNPVIVFRGSGTTDSPADGQDRSGYQLFYDDGGESGLRRLPPSMTEFLFGSGFDRLLDQISSIELNANLRNPRSCENPPASKSAIESLPLIEIDPSHLESDAQSHCAVCKEGFSLQSTAREMPCKHIYHSDCILPWLAMRNSCPVCRHVIPAEDGSSGGNEETEGEDAAAAGLTIWRLPGGGFAVGRIPGGGRRGSGGDGMMPVVYTEMDGGRFNNERPQRRVSWRSASSGEGGGRRRGRGFVGRIVRNLFGCFTGSRSESESGSRVLVFNTSSSSRSSSRG